MMILIYISNLNALSETNLTIVYYLFHRVCLNTVKFYFLKEQIPFS